MPDYVEVHDHHGLELVSTTFGTHTFTYTLPGDLQEHDIIVVFRPKGIDNGEDGPTISPTTGYNVSDRWMVDRCSAADAAARAGTTITAETGSSRIENAPSDEETTADAFDAWVLRPVGWSDIASITTTTFNAPGIGSPGFGDDNNGVLIDDDDRQTFQRVGVGATWGNYRHNNQHPDVTNTPLGHLQVNDTDPALAALDIAWLDQAPFTTEEDDDPWEFYSRTEQAAATGVALQNPVQLAWIYDPWPEGAEPFGSWHAEATRLEILINGTLEEVGLVTEWDVTKLTVPETVEDGSAIRFWRVGGVTEDE